MASTPPALLAITDFPEQRLASAAESFGRESPIAGDAFADIRRAEIFQRYGHFPGITLHCAFILPQGLFCVFFPRPNGIHSRRLGGKLAARPARSLPSSEALFSSPAASFTFSLSRNSRCPSPPYNR
jgi:hypothetical protein